MNERTTRLAALSAHVADLITAIDDEAELAETLVGALCSMVPDTTGYATLLRPHRLPRTLFASPGLNEPTAEFTEGLYLIDPLYSAVRAGRRGVFTLRQVMPAGFEETEYFQKFYAVDGIVDELMHVTELPEGGWLLVGILRREEHGAFGRPDRSLHEALHPIVAATSRRVSKRIARLDDPPDRLDAKELERSLEAFGQDLLTPRELDVIHLVLLGHNTESIATQLAIAADTVKLHRKHSYAKLRVSSQGELFFKFLESIGFEERPKGATVSELRRSP